MKFPGWALLLAALVAGGCGKSDNASSPPATSSPPAASANPVAAPLNYVSTAVKGEQAAFKTIDTVSLNQEVQLFNVQEGRYPKSLEELVEKKYLGKLPEAPAGQKIVYDSAQGKVTVVAQ